MDETIYDNPISETGKSDMIISLLETVRLSVLILLNHLYNSLKSIKERRLMLHFINKGS